MWTKGKLFDEHSDITQVIQKCLAVGKKYFPREYPGIYCDFDIVSDFLFGVHKGLKKIKWDIGDPIFFLVRNGLFQIRKKRIRAFDKFLIVRCKCGKKIKFSDKPCHGLQHEKRMITKEIITNSLDYYRKNNAKETEQN